MALCSFQQYPTDLFLVVGTVRNMTLAPKSFSSAALCTYRFTNENQSLELMHKVSGRSGLLIRPSSFRVST
jgi:hypothetical protein